MDNVGVVETFIDLAETRQMLCSVDKILPTELLTLLPTDTTATNTTVVDITDMQCS